MSIPMSSNPALFLPVNNFELEIISDASVADIKNE